MTSKLARERLEKIKSWRETYGAGINVMLPAEEAEELACIALAAMDSESGCLPLDYLQGHKDGQEWAAQLAEANHPETGDWLYDDPIELAKAIRKGPDMPPVQPVADSEPVIVVGDDGGDALSYRRLIQSFEPGTKLYRHAQPAPEYPETLPCPVLLEPGMRFGKGVKTRLVLDAIQRRAEQYAELEAMTQEERAEYDANIEAFKAMLPQPVPVAYSDFESFWSSYIHPLAQDDELKGFAWDIWCAAMLAAAPQSPGSEPATVPGTWIPVSERMPEDDDFVYIWPRPDFGVELHVGQYCEFSPKGDGWYVQVHEQNYGIEWHPITVTHWMPLPAAPQEVRGE